VGKIAKKAVCKSVSLYFECRINKNVLLQTGTWEKPINVPSPKIFSNMISFVPVATHPIL